MKIKTYRAANIKEALVQIKKELGADAFILSRKEVPPKNIMGIGGRSSVEVTAAVDYNSVHLAATDVSSAGSDSVRFRRNGPPAAALASEVKIPETEAPGNQLLLEEIRKLRGLVQSMQSPVVRRTVFSRRQFSSAVCEEMYEELLSCGIDDAFAQELVESAYSDCKTGGAENKLALRDHIALHLSSGICIEKDLIQQTPGGGTQVIALVGPTGVGKTTTLAKLAAKAALQDSLKVALITNDTYRIAAIEQLRTYADIIGVPMRVAENVEDIERGLKAFGNKDLVLIDTPGRSQREVSNQLEPAEFLSGSTAIRKVLVVSATTKQGDLADILEKYKVFNPASLIFTKLDETGLYGPMLHELIRSRKPVAYVTVGQAVPRDIVQPTAAQLVNLTLGMGDPQAWQGLLNLAAG